MSEETLADVESRLDALEEWRHKKRWEGSTGELTLELDHGDCVSVWSDHKRIGESNRVDHDDIDWLQVTYHGWLRMHFKGGWIFVPKERLQRIVVHPRKSET